MPVHEVCGMHLRRGIVAAINPPVSVARKPDYSAATVVELPSEEVILLIDGRPVKVKEAMTVDRIWTGLIQLNFVLCDECLHFGGSRNSPRLSEHSSVSSPEKEPNDKGAHYGGDNDELSGARHRDT